MQPLHKPEEETSLVDMINSRLNDFDIISLLRLLKHNHISEQAMWFSSHNNIASQNRLIESVKLTNDTAFIEMNIGILASTGILPAHIRRFMERPEVDENQLQLFFQLFDHILISHYVGQLYPEINRSFFDDWSHSKACYLQLQNMRSEASLHWLLNTAFPEFKVAIAHNTAGKFDNDIMQCLGAMTLGATTPLAASDKRWDCKIYLLLRPEWNGIVETWQLTVIERITQWLIPLLQDFSINLAVYLCITRSDRHLKLRQHSVLGHDPFFTETRILALDAQETGDYCTLIHHQTLPHISTSKRPTTVWDDPWRFKV
jgi:hypothetical protein